jgi:cytochrome d ubiquinol oxidase subunit I
VSPSVSTAEVAVSIVAFFLLYAVIGVVAAVLMATYARRELPPPSRGDRPVVVPAVTY